ncbi:MAG: immunoglobulin domain-containing protein [Verrucomicrobia bacterium]|nr:immunoglobulin domain-containing protein [Verrucomicrobiota bacterium]
MKIIKLPSLLLTAALQVLPITRVFVATSPATGSSFAIVSTWIAGAVALLGSYDAMSGASTVITSPKTATATNGVPFSYRITTGPEVANTFAATPLPPALTVSSTSGRITGTPTVDGVFVIHLTASDNNMPSRTVTADLSLTILPPVTSGTAPSITSQPTSQTVTAGGNATFSVTATGTAPLSYQWRWNGTSLGGANGATLNLTSVTTNQAGTYTVLISNSVGSVTSSSAILTVSPAAVAPAIATQPASQTITEGGNASFSVTATATAPLSYQWRLNGANLGGANGATLNLTSVTTNQAGTYTVLISSSAGSVTSSPAILTVIPLTVAPTITTQPASQMVTAGGTATFSVAATGTAPLSYQWRWNGSNLGGATGSTLNLTGVTTNQAGNYTVIVSNMVGSVTSTPAILTVNLAAVAPTIMTPPANQTVNAGGNATFSVTAAGTAPLSYQWRLNGSNLGGATSSTVNLNGVTTNQAGAYTVVVSNPAGSVTSSPAILTVNLVAPTITTQPANQNVTAGGNATFSITAAGTAPLSYQWRLNGSNLGGATSSTVNLSGVTTNQAGSYAVLVSNPAGSVTSSPAVLSVTVVVVNHAPTISAIANQTVLMDMVTAPIAFTISDLETPAANLSLAASSTNESLLPATSVVFGGSSSNRTVTLTPSAGQFGNTEITIVVSDGSATAAIKFLLSVQPPVISTNQLTLIKNGLGSVTPDLTKTLLTLGRVYTITAIPDAGQLFANWSGSLASSSPTISFLLTSNLVLQANFIPSPYPSAQGDYAGLFYENDAVRQSSAGFFTASLTSRGTYSGSLQMGANRYSFNGQFNLPGQATSVIARSGDNPLTMDFQIGVGSQSDQITGRVTDGKWVSPLLGHRAVFNSKTRPSPYAGQYTLVIPGRANDPSVPAGDGFGSVRVDSSGKLKFTGLLADGTKISQGVGLSKNGLWPLYVPLYSGQGSLVSWLTFTNQPKSDLKGTVSWIKPANRNSRLYPNGFNHGCEVLGSVYTAPVGGRGHVLNLANASVMFSGGNLASSFTNAVTMASNNRVANLSANRLSLIFSSATGTFKGSVEDPASRATWTFSGTVLQKLNVGCGFLLGNNQSSQVGIAP